MDGFVAKGKAKQTQIPFGNDNKKDKGKGEGRRGFPSGMTARKAKATT
ncbi:hypothetical protein GRAN_2608 [Granulicella sibirica]|uniref:Uncharacterized protein n=1 Tax=Granulicella sibirica TaxID=2479048 RepID=A0A4Q0T2G1_9BACT|nr:hypothetical protein GRAN_2608 [Granulicella sibirica]